MKERIARAVREKPLLTWLFEQGYEESTVSLTLRHLRCAHAHWEKEGELIGGYLEHAQRRYIGYIHSKKPSPVYPKAYGAAVEAMFEPIELAPTRGKGSRKKPTFDVGQWRTLEKALGKSKVEDDAYLRLFMFQPYGIRDFLEMSVKDVRKEVDILKAPWLEGIPSRKTMGEILCVDSPKPATCAQTRLRRRLHHWSEQLGYAVDFRTLGRASAMRFHQAA